MKNNWVINNFWIKIVSLILAVITWFYVNGELEKEGRASSEIYKSSFKTHTKQPSLEEKQMNKGYLAEKK